MIDRIQVTAVFVNDQEAAKHFFMDKVGLKERVDMQMGPDFRWLEVGPEGGEASLSISKAFDDKTQAKVGGMTGVIFNTTDIETDVARMKDAGVNFSQEPTVQPWGGTEARFNDPDGNEFSLVQRGEG